MKYGTMPSLMWIIWMVKKAAASNALRELSKHMINQNMDTRVTALDESVELAPKLDAFLEKVEAGTSAVRGCRAH